MDSVGVLTQCPECPRKFYPADPRQDFCTIHCYSKHLAKKRAEWPTCLCGLPLDDGDGPTTIDQCSAKLGDGTCGHCKKQMTPTERHWYGIGCADCEAQWSADLTANG